MKKLHWSILKRLMRLNPKPRVVRRQGALWLLDPTDYLDSRILIGRGFEYPQLDRLHRLAEQIKAEHFFDCGANFGLYSVLMCLNHQTITRVDAFEPVSDVRWRLSANVGLNGLARKVTVHPLALSDRTGSAKIAINPKNTLVSTLLENPEYANYREFSDEETVEIRTLDDLFDLEDKRLLFKIDVEGFQFEVILGMRNLLARNIVGLQIETDGPSRAKIDPFLTELGYRCVDMVFGEAYYTNDKV